MNELPDSLPAHFPVDALREILDQANCMVIRGDARRSEGQFTWSFRALETELHTRIFGEGIDHHNGLLWSLVGCPDEASMLRNFQNAVSKRSPRFEQEFRVFVDGEIVWLHENGRITYFSDDHWRLDSVFTDVTGLRTQADRLETTAERHRLLLEATNDGLWEQDFLTSTTSYSTRARLMLGYAASQVPPPADRWGEFIHPEDRQAYKNAWRQHAEGDRPFNLQIRFRHFSTQTWRWYFCRAITLRDEEGKPRLMVGSLTDITEIRALESDVGLSRRLEAVGELATGFAHEFNNLLTPVVAHVEMLGGDYADHPELSPVLQPMRTGLLRARELTRRILAFGRNAPETVETVDLVEIIEEVVDLLRASLDRRIQLAYEPPSSPRWVRGNRTELIQVLMNLGLNARDAFGTAPHSYEAPDRPPRIEFAFAGGDQNTHRIVVRDNGPGIDRTIQNRVFEPFFTTKERGQGAGLGLALTRHMVQTYQGTISMDSTPGQGATFVITLPIDTAPPKRETETKKPTAPALPQPNISDTSALVVLIEDDAQVSTVVQRFLELNPRVQVQLFEDGTSGLAAVRALGEKIALVLTDLNLPGLHGLELVAAVRADWPQLPIIVYSGNPTSETRTRLATLGVSQVVAKPFTPFELEAAMQATVGFGFLPNKPKQNQNGPKT